MEIEKRTHVVITELGSVIRKVEADPSGTVRIDFMTPNEMRYQTGYLDPDDVDALIAALEEVRSAREVKETQLFLDKEGSIWKSLGNGLWGLQNNHDHDCSPTCGWKLRSVAEEYGPLVPVEPS